MLTMHTCISYIASYPATNFLDKQFQGIQYYKNYKGELECKLLNISKFNASYKGELEYKWSQ